MGQLGSDLPPTKLHNDLAGDLDYAIAEIIGHYKRQDVPQTEALAVLCQVVGMAGAEVVRSGGMIQVLAADLMAVNLKRGFHQALQERES